jgi:malate dehydrogenase (oxaloacetate-decarboxylating)
MNEADDSPTRVVFLFVTDTMMLEAARMLAANSPALKDSSASLLPPLTDLRRVAAEIAVGVGIAAQKDGLAAPMTEDELRVRVSATQWTPNYPSYCD